METRTRSLREVAIVIKANAGMRRERIGVGARLRLPALLLCNIAIILANSTIEE